MTKLNRIENVLEGIDGAKFHRLCNVFLSREGYKQINAVGLVVGKDKSKIGTPDTLLILPNRKYVFVEITTKEADPGKKFLKDIANCFNEAKTGIPVEKIQQIILCYNGELTTKEDENLRNVCQQNGSSLEVFGVGALAPALYNSYPDLAKDFLGVEIDTRQILEADSFVQTYGRNQLATPLDTPFYGREQEIEAIAKKLAESNVLILSGRPGSGKTRIALEAIERFQQNNPAFQSKCILYHGENLNDDIHAYFSSPSFYIVLVDDANRISALDSLLYLVQEEKPGRTIKLIITVRDYALDKLRTSVAKVSSDEPIEILPFDFERLSQMLVTSFGILNQEYHHRIFEISKGNPRIAVMCARIALDNQTIDSLRNVKVADLYAKYYQSLREDLTDFEDRDMLNVAAIVAFLRVVDFTNEEQMTKITEAYGVSSTVFREKAQRLHDLEVVDLYENEVVKVSDQVLATYLFYLAVFEEKTINFGDIIRNYFPEYRGLFIEVLNPLVSSFDPEFIRSFLAQSIEKFWCEWLPEQSEKTQCTFLSTFWFIRPDLSLDALEKLIDNLAENLEQDVPIAQYEWNAFAEGSIAGIFGALQLHGDDFVTAAKLAFRYLTVRPNEGKQIIQLLIKQ